MKKLLFAFMALTMLACSSDDSTPANPNNGNPENPNPENPECSGTYTGDVYLRSQADVNTFLGKKYCKIVGDLIFGGAAEASEKITDLSGFLDIEIISDRVTVAGTNVTSLNGLQHIQKVKNFEVMDNAQLTNLGGSPEVSALCYVYIYKNAGLTGTQGLSLKNSCSLLLVDNPNLADLVIGGDFDRLKALHVSNSSLVTLEGFENVTKIGDLGISYNPNLVSLKGLENVTNIVYLAIISNDLLPSLEHLHSITSIAEMTIFPDNTPYFLIAENDNLQSLSGLENVANYSGWGISISDNANLTDLCAIKNMLINSPSIMSSIIENNAFNPDRYQIKAGNCSQ